MPNMIIMRGLPGSGKSHFIEKYYPKFIVCSADNYFMKDGKYVFNPRDISKAHEACKILCIERMFAGQDVVIDNTNTERWEYEFYWKLAAHMGYNVEFVNIYDGGLNDESLFLRNTHGVPLASITAMRARYYSPLFTNEG